MTTLALLIFAGQASAQQVSLALGEGSTSTVSGSGTEIVVEVSVTGATESVNAYSISFDYNDDLLSLKSATNGAGANLVVLGSALSLLAPGVPPSLLARAVFTTDVDVANQAFSIGVSGGTFGASSNTLMFNSGDGNGGNGGGGTPPSDDLSGSLTTSDSVINVGASQEIDVAVAVAGMTGKTAGAEIVFAVNPAVAMITGVEPASGLGVLERDGMRITLGGIPTTLSDGLYATVTFTTNDDVTAETEFSIGAEITVFTEAGTRKSVGSTASLKVNETPPVEYGGSYTTRVLTYIPPVGGTGQLTLEPEVVGPGADRAVLTFSLPGNPEDVTISSEGQVGDRDIENCCRRRCYGRGRS